MTPLIFVAQRLLFVICLLASSLLNFAQQLPDYAWGRAISGRGYLNVGYSVIDAPGDVYMAGTFDQWVDFDPGPDSAKLTAVGDFDAFVCKQWYPQLCLYRIHGLASNCLVPHFANGYGWAVRLFRRYPDVLAQPGRFFIWWMLWEVSISFIIFPRTPLLV